MEVTDTETDMEFANIARPLKAVYRFNDNHLLERVRMIQIKKGDRFLVIDENGELQYAYAQRDAIAQEDNPDRAEIFAQKWEVKDCRIDK